MEGTFTTSIQELVCCAPMLWCGGGVLVWVGVVVVQTAGVVREKNGEKGGREWWWRFGWVSELELGEWRMEGF
ncbi:hypothetical protein RHGRI_005235 [Rhododendron griersonianum]|uniref:Transmembrane protein n=1 Tax=Rhododendron griersonianum TaxID=479676 RepID=A0AAV6LC97_9ERIC|nr:hypothetical protein RHGRI_005235 [Rhododendron griersonianum]